MLSGSRTNFYWLNAASLSQLVGMNRKMCQESRNLQSLRKSVSYDCSTCVTVSQVEGGPGPNQVLHSEFLAHSV